MPSESPILAACIDEFRKTKRAIEACVEQLSDDELHLRINAHQNSIAVILQHVAGNLRSRWTDFLTADGEKPDRDRESEFVERRLGRSELLVTWENGWQCLFDALAALTDGDLARTITIRREPMSVFSAINRQTAHYNLHLGQIQVIGKHLRGEKWRYLSIPPGQSRAYNEKMGMK